MMFIQTMRKSLSLDELNEVYANPPDLNYVTNELPEHPIGDGTVPQRALEDCAICYEQMTSSEDLVFCKYVCGNSVHAGCFNMWKRACGRNVTCVYCRKKWKH